MVIRDKILPGSSLGGQVIVYVRISKSALMLRTALVEHGYKVTSTQGVARPEDRVQLLKEFERGLAQVLILTDVVALGFDQSKVNLVVNYNLPRELRNHSEPHCRIYSTRTRDKVNQLNQSYRCPYKLHVYNATGVVFNLLCGDTENMMMEKIERRLNYNVTEVPSSASDDYKNVFKGAGLIGRFASVLTLS
ncbi:DEAD-box ATP-dependent RNA helicase 38-like [Bidens hawaiensis]|uniref:DEAD-box ATP-dependent RNA helicase 38-like n=1 Tax=Bidens hawaiensis TaxID=980011 RepID=UPI00404B6CCF